MIVEKIYKVNTINIDSAILEIAEDIKKGYTVHSYEKEPLEMKYCCSSKIWHPNIIITLHNKEAFLKEVKC